MTVETAVEFLAVLIPVVVTVAAVQLLWRSTLGLVS